MKIIDSHLHFCPGYEYFDRTALRAGHVNTEEHLRGTFKRLGITAGIVMGNHGITLEEHRYPDFLKYCIGLDSHFLAGNEIASSYDLVEQHLRRSACVGVKLYPGYSPIYVSDRRYEPVYELARAYHKPVAVHMGQTAGSNALLKYSHPLTLDEVAVSHPGVQFVMCHMGNPWLMDAAAVIEKNENVVTDLSGLLEGKLDVAGFLEEQSGYLGVLKTWIAYISDYSKFLFGTDWPLANYEDYIGVTKKIIPEKHWDAVFSGNAERIYSL